MKLVKNTIIIHDDLEVGISQSCITDELIIFLATGSIIVVLQRLLFTIVLDITIAARAVLPAESMTRNMFTTMCLANEQLWRC